MQAAVTPNKNLIKSVAVPNEHGGWGFTLEPVLLGLLVAPNPAGWGLGLLALMGFLGRHPIKLCLADLRRRKMYPRTRLALGFAALYVTLGLFGLWLAISQAQQNFWLPLLCVTPLMGVQLWFDAQNKGRNLLPELCGAIAMGAVATAIALADGTSSTVAYALWMVLAVRSVTSIYFARTQVMRARKQPTLPQTSLLIGILGWFALAFTGNAQLTPMFTVIAMTALLGYQVYAFRQPPVAAKVVGWGQMAFGLLFVICTVVGVQTGI
ncbi:YwiC-like family protein [Deinococcus cellulosilyticus]|uniref:Prenyltransferase n=1 Tax=Deinococcus cellulosilyticus (strain DSM 18568 / NBRC 106333 / KACC 11606 / 5516J-15) TaxID=1223518 RepID=A0A511MZF5_DEIC1|nr:YwiC-like family protein [Deinococcus cellulosilyticus]GEM45995.1 hypothetical protein DC3_16300 [Deinococcus cellulosilyticus NBRC 106333 = KACC 11606]